jgi:hypothetical protein
MRIHVIAAAMMLTVITAGCSSAPQTASQPVSKPAQAPVHAEPQRPKPPANPLHGDRVTEAALPSELAAWKDARPGLPGGIARVVGDALYVLASPGGIGEDTYGFTIGDVKVLDKRVEVEAYLVRTKSEGKQGRIYPKDYVKVAYTGNARELPVELKINYSDAAYAHVKGAYDVVPASLLPNALQGWGTPVTGAGGEAAVFGDYLYVMVGAGERLKEGQLFRIGNVALHDGKVDVIASLEQLPSDAPPEAFSRANQVARIPYKGDEAPLVALDIREVVLADLSKVDRVVVQHTLSKREKALINDAAIRLATAIAESPAVASAGLTSTCQPVLQFKLFAGTQLVASAVGGGDNCSIVIIDGENARRQPSGPPKQLLDSIVDSLK